MIEIPVTNDPEQKFSISLKGTLYQVRISYNTFAGVWTLDLETGGSPVISGVFLVGGVNLVKQYNIPLDNLYAINVNDPTADATAESLGQDVRLIVFEDGELDASDI